MTDGRGDAILALWLVLGVAWSVTAYSVTTWLVFWQGYSGWWFLLTVLVTTQPTLFKALARRMGVSDD